MSAVGYDLKSAEAIKALFSRYAAEPPDSGNGRWQKILVSFLECVGKASLSERTTIEFHRKLWDENEVTSVGKGTIRVDAAIQDSDFREWLARTSLSPLPTSADEVLTYFEDIHRDMLEKLQPHCPRTPRLQVFRVMAALYPRHL